MKYPFQPKVLDAMPEQVAELYRELETYLLAEICGRVRIADNLNEVTIQDIRALRAHGIPLSEIRQAIQKHAKVSKKKLDELFDIVVARNNQYYNGVATAAKITMPEHIVSVADVDAIRRQTWSAMQNISGTMGFLYRSGGRLVVTDPAKALWRVLDDAEAQMMSGAATYTTAIKNAVQRLADSGIRTVDYESGHVDQADVAVRRAVMTGIVQLNDKYTQQSMEYLDTEYCEVSAHSGARDQPGRTPWASHKDWQGRVYYVSTSGEPDPLGKYKDLAETTGFGEVDGLEGANCRHIRFPWVEGVSERTYTDEQLEHIDDGLGCTFEGKKYSAYEATQKQREIERTIRKLTRRETAYKAAGLSEEASATTAKIKRLKKEYSEFSKAAHLPEQKDRMKVIV